MSNPISRSILHHIFNIKQKMHLRIYSVVPEVLEWIDNTRSMLAIEECIKIKTKKMDMNIKMDRQCTTAVYVREQLNDRDYLQEILKTWDDIPS